MKSAHGYRRSRHVNIFSIFSSGGHFVYWSSTILAVLVGRPLGNIPVKGLNHIGPRVEEEIAVKANNSRFSILALAAILFIRADHFRYFDSGSPRQHSYQV